MKGARQEEPAASGFRPQIANALSQLAAEAPVRLTVRGGCMRPLLEDGERVVVAGARWFWPGDVIAFPAATGDLVVHRVIGYRPRGGRLRLQTRADATGTLDPPVDPRNVIGRIVCRPVSWRDRMLAMARCGRLWAAGLLPR